MIDWDRVAELRAEIGDEDFLEVGQLFVSEIEEKLSAMDGDQNNSAEDFHYLRGSAANLGLSGFAHLCAEAESSARGGGKTDFSSIRLSFEQSMAELGDTFAA